MITNVLVATTIIESGLDLPQVNTMIVERADLLGLAQLYQLRGRVGRSSQRAYAYLFHPEQVSLSEDAHRRLEAIGEFADLGSGFQLAMRDLEIRGAGSILGNVQSGHISAVGLDLYIELVADAVNELEHGPADQVKPSEVRIELPVTAHLPTAYVPDQQAQARSLPTAGGCLRPGIGRGCRSGMARTVRAAAARGGMSCLPLPGCGSRRSMRGSPKSWPCGARCASSR